MLHTQHQTERVIERSIKIAWKIESLRYVAYVSAGYCRRLRLLFAVIENLNYFGNAGMNKTPLHNNQILQSEPLKNCFL